MKGFTPPFESCPKIAVLSRLRKTVSDAASQPSAAARAGAMADDADVSESGGASSPTHTHGSGSSPATDDSDDGAAAHGHVCGAPGGESYCKLPLGHLGPHDFEGDIPGRLGRDRAAARAGR